MTATVGSGSFQAARDSGVADALTAAYRALGANLHVGPRGHALAPAAVLDAAVRTCPDEPRDPSGERRLDLPPDLEGLGIVALRCGPGIGTVCCAAFLTELTWLRFGLSHALLDSATGFARTRSVGGKPLLHQQLVKGALADVLIDLAAIDADLSDAPDDARLTDLHAVLTRVDRALLRLMGA